MINQPIPPMGLSGQPNQQIKINLDDLEKVKCESCDGECFDIVWIIRKVPAMLSQTGKVSLFPVAYFRCLGCLKITNIINRG